MKRISIIVLFMCLFIPNIVINAWSEYTIGQEVEYNGINFYVIKNSGTKEDSVTMLKAEPLSVSDVNTYGTGHVNMYATKDTNSSYYQQAYDQTNDGNVGGMVYYSSTTCGWSGSEWVYDGCTTNYATSEIKYVVDAWATAKTTASDLRADSTGYKARLLTIDDLIDNLGYSWQQTSAGNPTINENVPSFMIPENNSYWYWTMSQHLEDASNVWYVDSDGSLGALLVGSSYRSAVRPVITLSKTALGDNDANEIDNNESEETISEDKSNIDSKEKKTKVSVPNTYVKTSIVIIVLGIIIAGIGIFMFYKMSNKKK